MKTGDTFPVTIAGQEVTQAKVVELDDGTATLVFEGKRVVMATRTDLTDDKPQRDDTQPETVITGVDRAQASGTEGNPTDAPVTPNPPNAPVEEKPAASDGPAPTPENTDTDG